MFAQDFMLHHISIKGEVSNCKYHSSGHIYFTMKDADGTINAIMFAGSRREGLKFPMKEGDRVVVTGSVEVYERDGRYQIYARAIERDGEGNLYLKFEALKRELEEMGMFACKNRGDCYGRDRGSDSGYPQYCRAQEPVCAADSLPGPSAGRGCGSINCPWNSCT